MKNDYAFVSIWKSKIVLLGLVYSIILSAGLAGPIEGFESTNDWWGPLVPNLRKVLPFLNWKFGWEAFYTIILYCSILIINAFPIALSNRRMNLLLKSVFLYLIPIFIVMNVRDGLSFFFFLLGSFSLINFIFTKRIYNSYFWLFVFTISFLVAISFKVSLTPLFFVSYGMILWFLAKNKFWKIISLLAISFIVISANYLLITTENIKLGLEKSHPEKQVYYYDLASAYCWSNNKEIQHFSEEILIEDLKTNLALGDICKNLTPIGWDSLRKVLDVENPPNSSRIQKLKNGWMELYVKSPTDFIEVKVNFVGQVLTMANSVTRGRPLLNTQSSLASIVSILIAPAWLADKLRLFTLLCSFFLVFLLATRSTFKLIPALIVWFSGFFSNLMFYVANNGRYSFSTTLLTFIIASISIPENNNDAHG